MGSAVLFAVIINDKGENKMADRYTIVQDIFANKKNVHDNTPTMLKWNLQIEPEEVYIDRKVASKEINLE